MADRDDAADAMVTATPVVEPQPVEATVHALEAIVGLERGAPAGAAGKYADAFALRDALEPVFENSLDLVGIIDDRGGIVYLNAAARVRFGQSEQSGYSAERLYPPAAWDLYYREIRPSIFATGAWRGVVPMRLASGDIVQVRQTVTGGVSVAGDTIEWLFSIAEDTREAEPVFPDPSRRDFLTGLANRAWFEERLADALANVHEDGIAVGVVHCELLSLGEVSDAHGLAVANVVLIALGRRLVALSGPHDVVARYRDRELVVLSESVQGARDIARLAWQIRSELSAEPVAVGDQSFAIETAVGVATASTQGRDAIELINAARARGRKTT